MPSLLQPTSLAKVPGLMVGAVLDRLETMWNPLAGLTLDLAEDDLD